EAMEPLSKLLQDKDAGVRRTALIAVYMTGKNEEGVIATLSKILTEADVTLRRIALTALTDLSEQDDLGGEREQAVYEALAHGPKEKDQRLRVGTAQGLTGSGSAAVPGLVKLLKGTEKTPRLLAAAVLAAIGAEAADAIPALEEMAKDKNPEV